MISPSASPACKSPRCGDCNHWQQSEADYWANPHMGECDLLKKQTHKRSSCVDENNDLCGTCDDCRISDGGYRVCAADPVGVRTYLTWLPLTRSLKACPKGKWTREGSEP